MKTCPQNLQPSTAEGGLKHSITGEECWTGQEPVRELHRSGEDSLDSFVSDDLNIHTSSAAAPRVPGPLLHPHLHLTCLPRPVARAHAGPCFATQAHACPLPPPYCSCIRCLPQAWMKRLLTCWSRCRH